MSEKIYTYYKVYGLVVKSELELKELEKVTSVDFDVLIEKGKVPEKLKNPEKIGVRFEAKKNEFLLSVDNICKFHISNGNKIIIENIGNPSLSEIKLFLLGSAFGALIFQRGKVPFHGSTVLINGKAVIISGVSGAGKSTITAELILRGYPIIADDVSLISVVDKSVCVFPGFARIKLWADTIDLLKIDDKLDRIRPQLEKYSYPVNNYHNKETEISNVVIIKTKNTAGVTIEEIKGVEKFKILNNNIYRKQFAKPLKVEKDQFKIIAQMSAKIKLYIIERPNSTNSINDVANSILDI